VGIAGLVGSEGSGVDEAPLTPDEAHMVSEIKAVFADKEGQATKLITSEMPSAGTATDA
jgi:hypothetical protein